MSASAQVFGGLWVGDSFAEARVMSFDDGGKSAGRKGQGAKPHILFSRRWWLSRRSLRDGLEDLRTALTEREIEIKNIAWQVEFARRVRAHHSRRPGPHAMLTTAGFEQHLLLTQAWNTNGPAATAERQWSPLERDFVLGVGERTTADGTISKTPEPSELEFLVSKLELLKTRHLAICFLHSPAQAENELRVERFFQERGFTVFCSHRFKGDELERWRACASEAYFAASLEEEQKALDETLKTWELAKTPLVTFESSYSVDHPVLHLGLEVFQAILPDRSVRLLPIQPTQNLGASTWQIPSWTAEDRGYEPGPMIFGKSQNLTTLDLLFAGERLKQEIEGVTDRLQTATRARARILEVLYTLGKDVAKRDPSRTDSEKLVLDLERALADRIVNAVNLLPAASLGGKTLSAIELTGALAPSLIDLLAARRPDVQWTLDSDNEWFLPRELALRGTR